MGRHGNGDRDEMEWVMDREMGVWNDVRQLVVGFGYLDNALCCKEIIAS